MRLCSNKARLANPNNAIYICPCRCSFPAATSVGLAPFSLGNAIHASYVSHRLADVKTAYHHIRCHNITLLTAAVASNPAHAPSTYRDNLPYPRPRHRRAAASPHNNPHTAPPKMGFGDFKEICSHTPLPLCSLVGDTSPITGTHYTQTLCYSRTIELANTMIFQGAAGFAHILALIMTVIMIVHVRSKFTAVGAYDPKS